MVNFDNLKKYQDSFGYIAMLLSFPEKLTFNENVFNESITSQHPGYQDIVNFREVMMNYTLSEAKQIYTDTFDFSKNSPLYMTYNKFETQKERGQMLAKLKVLYEMFGLKMVDNELSDYLPLMLEFLQTIEWYGDDRAEENIQLVIMIIEDGTYALANELGKHNHPYGYVIQALRKTLKLCLKSPEGVTQHD